MITESFREARAALFADYEPLGHSLLKRSQEKQLSPQEILAIMGQLGHVVTSFPRFLGALVANLPTVDARMPIVENLLEEHGNLDLNKVHIHTFELFLESFGKEASALTRRPPIPGTRAYIRCLYDQCLNAPWRQSLACMGVIEEIFAYLSQAIARAVVESGAVDPADLKHFDLHSEVDLEHAEGMYRVLEPFWKNSTSRAEIRDGVEMGLYLDCRLMDDLEVDARKSVLGKTS
ncbi:MAG TPA: iron-containing redox enzyme family protein [Candidatus Manganitrophaceae bacterium]|nr:iron-containing redox enzyme family protein [Candidatus Manganitrophaceae bacterium]